MKYTHLESLFIHIWHLHIYLICIHIHILHVHIHLICTHIFDVYTYTHLKCTHTFDLYIHTYGPFPRRWDSKWSLEYKTKSSMFITGVFS